MYINLLCFMIISSLIVLFISRKKNLFLDVKDTMHKIYSRDTIPYMKPDERSFIRVQQDLFSFSKKEGIIFFFDDLLEK